MDIVIPAGGIPRPGNPLCEYTQGRPKALLDVAGKPMIQWVLDAVSETNGVEQVTVVGLDGSVMLSCAKRLTILPNHGSMIGNIRAGVKHILEKDPNTEYVMTCASDIPLVTGDMFDGFIAKSQTTHHELYMNMVTYQVMESRFPGVKRRTGRVGNLELRGAVDIIILRPRIILQTNGAADRFERARGNPWRQLNFIGFDTLAQLMLRRLDLDSFVKRLSKKHGVDLSAIICPYAEIAMDVDEPIHLEIMRRELSDRK